MTDLETATLRIAILETMLAAERGDWSGAASPDWRYVGNGPHVESNPWFADYDYPYSGRVERFGAGRYWWGVEKRDTDGYLYVTANGYAPTAYEAMQAADVAVAKLRAAKGGGE